MIGIKCIRECELNYELNLCGSALDRKPISQVLVLGCHPGGTSAKTSLRGIQFKAIAGNQ